jgi:Flp pilus assembly protein TadG
MKKFLVVGLLAVGLLVGSGMAVWAADDSEDVIVQWNIVPWIDLIITGGTTTVNLGDVSLPDQDYSGDTTYYVNSNADWDMGITAIAVSTKPVGATSDAAIIAAMNHDTVGEELDSGTAGTTPANDGTVTWTLNIPLAQFVDDTLFPTGAYAITYTLTAYNPPSIP